MADAIDAMRAAFGDDRDNPHRVQLAGSLFMPGRVGRHTGFKAVSVVPGSPAGIVVVFGEDGAPLGMVDGPTLTAIRTAAAAGLATDLLAPPEASVLAMLGAGAMAADQIAAVREVRPIERVVVWSRSPERAQGLAEAFGGEAMADPDSAVVVADIVTTATPATSPLFDDDALSPVTHINAVGAFTPEMIEVPVTVTREAFVVVDDLEAAAIEAGDLLQAGVEPDAELGDVLADRVEVPSGTTTLFKSVGIASQDVAAAVAALARAEVESLGTAIG